MFHTGSFSPPPSQRLCTPSVSPSPSYMLADTNQRCGEADSTCRGPRPSLGQRDLGLPTVILQKELWTKESKTYDSKWHRTDATWGRRRIWEPNSLWGKYCFLCCNSLLLARAFWSLQLWRVQGRVCVGGWSKAKKEGWQQPGKVVMRWERWPAESWDSLPATPGGQTAAGAEVGVGEQPSRILRGTWKENLVKDKVPFCHTWHEL